MVAKGKTCIYLYINIYRRKKSKKANIRIMFSFTAEFLRLITSST